MGTVLQYFPSPLRVLEPMGSAIRELDICGEAQMILTSMGVPGMLILNQNYARDVRIQQHIPNHVDPVAVLMYHSLFPLVKLQQELPLGLLPPILDHSMRCGDQFLSSSSSHPQTTLWCPFHEAGVTCELSCLGNKNQVTHGGCTQTTVLAITSPRWKTTMTASTGGKPW